MTPSWGQELLWLWTLGRFQRGFFLEWEGSISKVWNKYSSLISRPSPSFPSLTVLQVTGRWARAWEEGYVFPRSGRCMNFICASCLANDFLCIPATPETECFGLIGSKQKSSLKLTCMCCWLQINCKLWYYSNCQWFTTCVSWYGMCLSICN